MPSNPISHQPSAGSIELYDRGETSAAGATRAAGSPPGSPAADVRSLRRGSFPHVQQHSDEASRIVDEIYNGASYADPSSPALETAHETPPQVASLRSSLQGLPATTRPLARLAAQFQLEGAALRAMVTDTAHLEKLASGELLKEAVEGKLPRNLCQLLSRDEIYRTVNAGAPGAVTPPFPDQELAHAGITGTSGELDAHRIALVDEAFKHVVARLDAGGTRAQQVDIKLAHQAFKIGIAVQENALETTVLDLQVRAEVASNEILAKPSTRNKKTQDANVELAQAKTALATFSKGSNIVLQQEHLDDLNSRAITDDDNIFSTSKKMLGQLPAGGATQGVVSGTTWGVVSNLANGYAQRATANLAPVADAVVSQLMRGTALGLSHKFMSDGPRDMFQALFELGGWSRPPEPSSPEQLYPDPRRSTLDADGRPQLVDPATVDAANDDVKQKRQNFADKSKRKDFGNVTTDNNGQSSFGEVNAGRDLLNSVGLDEVNSLTGRSITSMIGGVRMSTISNADMLKLRIDGKPAFAEAKRPNPRDITTRLVTGMKKLNLAKEDNRMDLFSKITSASAGMIVAEAMDKLLSEPLQAAIDAMPEGKEKIAAQSFGAVAHAGIEYGKSFGVLGGFFSGAAAKEDAKTAPGRSPAWQRLFVGPDNMMHPTKRTTAFDSNTEKGTWTRQAINKFESGVFQTVAQSAALVMEGGTLGLPGTLTGTAELVKEGVEKGTEIAQRMARSVRGSDATPAAPANNPGSAV